MFTTSFLALLTWMLAALSPVRAAAPDHANTRTYDVGGVVQAILEDGRPVIAHEDVPGFMPAMTMAFDVSPDGSIKAVHRGDRVRFKLTVTATDSRATDFVVIASAAAQAPSPAVAPIHRLRIGDAVPDFSLLDESAQPLMTADLRNRYTVLTFVFTRCPVPEFCPAMALRFGELQRAIIAAPEIAQRAKLLSITLDPEFDRPEILTAYGQAVGAEPALWNFATGDTDQITHLARAFSVYVERDGALLNHTLCTALIGPDGRVLEIWRGHGWKSVEVIAALGAAITSN